jgi:ketosteroid isomerase-like protein
VEADETIRQTLAGIAQAISTGDFETWGSFWHPDAREFAPNTPAAVGRVSLLYRAKAWFREWIHDMAIRCDEVHVAGDWAFASGGLSLRSVARRGEKAHLLSGNFLAVLTDHGNGRWLMYRFCYTSSIPLVDDQ